MKSTSHGFSSNKIFKKPRKTKKRLAVKAAARAAKASKKGKKMYRPSRARS